MLLTKSKYLKGSNWAHEDPRWGGRAGHHIP